MEGQSGLSELSVISWVSAFEGCLLGGVPLYTFPVIHTLHWDILDAKITGRLSPGTVKAFQPP